MKKSGFTIVEIMIAVLVVGILLAIAVPMLSKIREESRIDKAESDVEMLVAAVRQLAWDTGKWPGGATRTHGDPECWDLSTDSAGLLGNDGTFDAGKWDGPYARDIDADPWGNPYFFDSDYYPNGMGTSPKLAVVGSFGPNGSGRNIYDDDNIYSVLERW